MSWTIKGYTVDRRPPGERNKSAKTKVDPDLEVSEDDPLAAVEELRAALKAMDLPERREFVRFRLIGPDPQQLLGPVPEPAGETSGSEDEPPTDGGDDGQQAEG